MSLGSHRLPTALLTADIAIAALAELDTVPVFVTRSQLSDRFPWRL